MSVKSKIHRDMGCEYHYSVACKYQELFVIRVTQKDDNEPRTIRTIPFIMEVKYENLY